ncbi:MAG: CDP-alcohol phosphatidyltransferase family protein [Clostridia bacterium]|nr:CDP-alcohol phosphatidyltransferase family protein [Clostridia bacterium]
MANIITGTRILASLLLLFFPAFSPAFYALYIFAGISDMVDGTAARKTNTVSNFGSAFDTAADFVFTAASLVKLLPALKLPVWILIWAAAIVLIKTINIVSGFAVAKRFVPVHSIMNRVAGVLLFVLPLTRSLVDIRYGAAVVCAVATFAAVQEGHYIRTGRVG